VRGCFAQERRGRADWSARAVYSLVLHDREVVAAAVEGPGVSERLEACLLDAVDQLVVPPSEDGLVVVRYPFVASKVASPPRVEIDPSLGHALDRLFASEPEAP
jgi:hypothetical protein